jgi:protocatechuate 3,4-dioxygenase beta subunit
MMAGRAKLVLTTITGLMLSLMIGVAAQDPAAPPDSIRGTVVRADTRSPLPRVRLELVPEEYAKRPTGYEKVCKPSPDIEPSRLRRVAMTDDNGRFTFMDIPSGRYLLSAEHEGYLRAEWGQRGKFPIGTVLAIGPQADLLESIDVPLGRGNVTRGNRGQSAGTLNNPVAPGVRTEVLPPGALQNLSISLYPAPTISGRVFDDESRTVAAGVIQAYQLRYTPLNGRSLRSIRSTLTNDRGEYRLFWLNPGEYYIAGGYTDSGLQPWREGLRLTPNLPNADSRLPMLFYPDAAKASDAVAVPLNAGSDAIVDIRLRARPRFTVRVRLTGNALPPNANLVFVPQGGDLCAAIDYAIKPGRDGQFEIRDVPEGVYVMMAMLGRSVISDMATVKVDRGDANELLPVVPPIDVWGTITFTNAPKDLDLSGVRVNLTRTRLEVSHVATAALEFGTNEFRIPGVGPGSYYATVDLPPGAYVDSVTALKFKPGTRECTALPRSPRYRYLDSHLHLDPTLPLIIPGVIPIDAECLNIQVVFAGRFNGKVQTRTQEPVAGALVVALPRSLWGTRSDAGLTPPDHFLTATTDSQGMYRISGVFPRDSTRPVGDAEYRLYAFEDLDPNLIYDPAFADRFRNREIFTRLTVEPDGTRRSSIVTVATVSTCPHVLDQCILTVIPAADTVRGTQ